MADHDISKMTVKKLRRELKHRSLNTTGVKSELVERLNSSLIGGDVIDDTAILEESLDDNDDVLNDDELDEETNLLLNSTAQDEDAILSSPKGSTSFKSPENQPESSTSATSAPTHAKKIVLKRKFLESMSLTAEPTAKNKVLKLNSDENSDGDADSNVGGHSPKVIPNKAYRLKMRSAREAKKSIHSCRGSKKMLEFNVRLASTVYLRKQIIRYQRKNDEYTKFQVVGDHAYCSVSHTANYIKRIVRPSQPLSSEMNQESDSIGATSNEPTPDVDIPQTIELNPSKSENTIDYYIRKRETAEQSGRNEEKEYYDKLLLDVELETRKFKIQADVEKVKIQADVEKFKIQVEAIKSLHRTAEE